MEELPNIPEDIIAKLKKDYPIESEYNEAIDVINHVWKDKDRINVGWEQLSRSIILIADGDVSKMKEILEDRYYGDPRDVIMHMMSVTKDKYAYGMEPFEIG